MGFLGLIGGETELLGGGGRGIVDDGVYKAEVLLMSFLHDRPNCHAELRREMLLRRDWPLIDSWRPNTLSF